MRASGSTLAAVLVLSGAVAPAGAGTPSEAAAGTVERRVSADPALAALDRRLGQVYRAAAARAKGPLAARLRAEQRGWTKGRDECWKADGQPTWITASWTVATVRDCIDAQYRVRTAELQAVWRLLPPATVRYGCGSTPADELVLDAFATDTPTLRLERGDRSATLWQVGPPAEGRYEGANVALVRDGRQVTLSWLDTDTGSRHERSCRAR